MKVTSKEIKKINYFNSLSSEHCTEISKAVKLADCNSGQRLINEGDTGDTMLLVFQGQVEVSKNMMVKASGGYMMSKKPIIRLETTDPSPIDSPITDSTVNIVKSPAFGIGEFSLVLDNAIRTSNVDAMTKVEYGILKLNDFEDIVKSNPGIGGPVYLEIAKAAVSNLATASQDISNLTQAFFFALKN